MCTTYDSDLQEFERRIASVKASPLDEEARYSLCEQSRFVLDSVEQAVLFYDNFINKDRLKRALDLFTEAVKALKPKDDRYSQHVIGRLNKAKVLLKTGRLQTDIFTFARS